MHSDKERIKRKLRAIKRKGKCKHCGEEHTACLEFHHKDSDIKNGEIGSMIAKFTYEEIMEELRHCIILCSNCHRKLHWEEVHND